ncbi:alkaline phosphatase D family protein [Acinetobacter sp. XS-4]|uniref:alkaline phosphatase D family protein n=1 Tax=Acinetobacter sp. XS-4 TaxID=2923375 RepID=UPI00208FD2BC|nr:alkaline phosphatase D family protein [Acinetobacter sp. XS-4]USP41267.1 alkaline phosphatase D family protein [Acinetobacter sp. XS-4]
MSEKISRRELIQKSLFGFGALSLPVAFTGCNDGSDDESTEAQVDFLHGVASGDPLQDKVILWTRLTPVDISARLKVTWEIATDDQFKQNLKTGVVQTTKTDDFTVKVDATGLQADTIYYYRFHFGNKTSSVGQTKTLPVSTKKVSFAVCSCSNYPAGYFYVYREIAKQNVDVVIHLGDYIYEYGDGVYPTKEDTVRALDADNNKEIIKLDDYRKRYALYRQDKDLQAAHQRHSFIVIWDDHELANDTWRDGAENHQDNEGSFSDRKLAALQAYFEWMPIRPISSTDHLNIYRQFNFGSLVHLTMLDTRIIARDKQLEYKDYMTASGLDAQKFRADLMDSKRTLMGHTQRDWLVDKLKQSTATWNVIGQQVLMSKMWIPAELLLALGQITSGGASADTLAKMNVQIKELVALKLRLEQGDPTLTIQDKARVTTLVPYNLDAWDGYDAEREFVYDKLTEFNKKIIVLAGDTHNAWTSYLHSQKGGYVGVELATSSVSSPGLEKYLSIPLAQLQQFEFAFTTLIDELTYCNLNQRGYLVVTLGDTQVQSDWIFVDSIKNTEYEIDSSRSFQLVLDKNLTPEKDKQKTA